MVLKHINSVFKKVLFFFYPMVFGNKPGPEAERFLRNLTFVVFALVLAKFFSVIFQVYVGAELGPAEYGKFAMILSIFHFLYVPMLMSIGTAMIKFLAGEKDEAERKKLVSTSFILTGIFTVFFAVVFFLISPQLAILTQVTQKYVFAAILLAVAYVCFLMSQKIYQSFNKMKKLGAINIINTLIFLVGAFILFTFFDGAIVPTVALFIGYIIPTLFVLPELRKYFRFSLDNKWAKTLIRYGSIILLGTFCFAINENINKIFINIFLTLSDVGLFQAYYYSTMTVSAFFVSAFVLVFFPEASRIENKKIIFDQVKKTFKFIPLVFIGLFAVSSVILFFYGSSYTVYYDLLSLFIVAAIVNFIFFVYVWLSTSAGMSGVKLTSYSIALASAFSITLSYLLIPIYGLYGAVGSTLVSYSIGLVFIYLKLKNIVSKQNPNE